MGNPRWYTFTCSAATGSNETHELQNTASRVFAVISGVTAFNAGAGNTRVSLIGKNTAMTAYAIIGSALTEVGSAFVYDFGIMPPFEKIRLSLGTAPSGVATVYVGLLDL
jgi:hypothetical protein